MTSHNLVYTRVQLNALDSYATGVKVPEIALQLKRSESWTWRQLRFLHITNPATARQPYAKPLPDDSPLRCKRCGVLFTEANWVQVEVDGEDTDVPVPQPGEWRRFLLMGEWVEGLCCDYCTGRIDGTPSAWTEPGGGDAPELKVFEMFGMAAGRDR